MKLKACVLLLLLPVVVCRPQVGHDQEKIGLGRLGSKLAQRLVAGRRDSSIPDYQAKGFLNCCMNNLKTQGVSDKCINFLCTYNHANNARFGPTIEVTLPDESKEACFNDNFKVRAYLECYTNSRDNTECCKGAGIPGDDEPADPERKGCLALCDGTHDLPGLATYEIEKCSVHDMGQISKCNAQAYEPTFTPPPKRFTGYPTLMCPATTTVIVSGFKVVNCVHPTPSN